MMRFMPGFVGAAAAFLVSKLLSWFSWADLSVEIAAFLATYAAVAYSVDRAMTRYGGAPPR
jgi:hypothetical protein